MRGLSSSSIGFVCLAAMTLASVAPAGAGLIDSAPHSPPQYYTFVPPARGASFVDPVFGTSIKRLSAAPITPDNADGGMLTFVSDEYATMSAFNSNGSRFILQHDSYFGLYNGQGGYLRDLPFEIHAGSEPRWSRTNANLVYFLRDNQVKSFNVSTNATAVVRTFSEYGVISGKGESDICFDGNHLVLAGDDRFVFVYDLATNSKGPVLDTAGHGGFDSLYVTPGDNVLISWYAHGTGRWRGVELFNENMVFQRQVARAGGHMDVTRDNDGSEVLVLTNSADPNPICDNGIVKVRLANAAATCLLELDWSLAVHIACPDGDGTCIVGTYAPGDPAPGGGNWPSYTNELLEVRLNGTQTMRLAHHRSRPFNDYMYAPRATVSRDGTRILYSSNHGLQEIQGMPTEYGDTYLIELSGGGGGNVLVFNGHFNGGGTAQWSSTHD